MAWLNYHHLLYFWTVAKRGSIAEAALELNLTQPAVSAQIKTLERSLKVALLVRRGRRLELTDVGRMVARYAEEIFSMGQGLKDALAGRSPDRLAPLRIGVVDALPKLLVHRLLRPAFEYTPATRVVVHEAKLDRLIADLAIHELDAVFADAPAPASLHIRTHSHLVLEGGVSFYAVPAQAALLRKRFPGSLHQARVLLPTTNTALRRGLDSWLAAQRIEPLIVAEIEDSAVLKVFGEEGLGAFAASTLVHRDVVQRYGVRRFGQTEAVREAVYAITVERQISNPILKAILGRNEVRSDGVSLVKTSR